MEESAPDASRRVPDAGAQGGDIIERLSEEERSAILELANDPRRRSIPDEVALRLLQLGLAEVLCGRLALTRGGRQALTAVSG